MSAGPRSLQRPPGGALPASSSSRWLRISEPEAASLQPLPRPSQRLLLCLCFNLPLLPLLRDGVWAQLAEPRCSPYLAALNLSTSAQTLFPNKVAFAGSGAESLDLPLGAAVSLPPTARPARGPPILALHPLLPGAPTLPHRALSIGSGRHGKEHPFRAGRAPSGTRGLRPGPRWPWATLRCPELELSPAGGGHSWCRCAGEGCGRPCWSGGRGVCSRRHRLPAPTLPLLLPQVTRRVHP